MSYTKITRIVVLVICYVAITLIGEDLTPVAAQPLFEYRVADIIAWKSDGRYLAIATLDWVDESGEYQNQQIQIINAASGQIERSIPVGDFTITFLSWRDHDTELLMVNSVGEVKRFNAQNGSLISQWTIEGYQTGAINLHPAGSALAVVINPSTQNRSGQSDEKVLEIHNAETGTMIQSFTLSLQPDDTTSWLGWSADGTRFAITNRNGSMFIYLWNGAALSFQRQINFVSEDTGSSHAAWGPNSRDIAVVSARRTSLPGVVIYNSDTGTLLRQLNQSQNAYKVIWSKETNLITSRNGLVVRVWDAATGEVLQDFDYSDTSLVSLAWSPNGTLAVGRRMENDELAQNPNLTGIVMQRPSSLPTLTPTPTDPHPHHHPNPHPHADAVSLPVQPVDTAANGGKIGLWFLGVGAMDVDDFGGG